MSEQQHDPKYKVGDEISVDFMGRITEVKIVTDFAILGSKEKVVYYVEGSRGMRGMNIEESCVYPLPTPQDFPPRE